MLAEWVDPLQEIRPHMPEWKEALKNGWLVPLAPTSPLTDMSQPALEMQTNAQYGLGWSQEDN